MNGVSGTSPSGQPYLPKDDDQKKKPATGNTASPKPAEGRPSNPVNHYSTAERLADLYDMCAVMDTGPCNRKVATFFKSLAENHTDAPVTDKLFKAVKDVAKETAKDVAGESAGHALEKLVLHTLKTTTPLGIALTALERAHDFAEKASAVRVKNMGLEAGAPIAPAAGKSVAEAALRAASSKPAAAKPAAAKPAIATPAKPAATPTKAPSGEKGPFLKPG